MSLASLTFCVFLLCVLLLHRIAPVQAKSGILLLASYAFYASFGLGALGVLLLVTCAAYLGGITVSQRPTPVRLATSVVFTLAPLVTLKYLPPLAGGGSLSALGNVGVVVGLSFFTLQAVSYVVDVYRGTYAVERAVWRVGLYLAWFPVVTSGPIERPGHLLPQLSPRQPSWEDPYIGGKLILLGCFFKLVVADPTGAIVDAVLTSLRTASGATLTASSVLYSFQIYFDFLGYTTIAIGAARAFGIHVVQNFDRPYLAASLQAFWRRWHISLSSWFRDYVYLPLGGKQTSGPTRIAQVMAVFVISGVWHGTGLNYILWGGTHGVAYLIEERIRRHREGLADPSRRTRSGRRRYVGVLMTFGVVTFAWIFFRLPSIEDAMVVVAKILFIDRSVAFGSLDPAFAGLGAAVAFVSLAVAVVLDTLPTARRTFTTVPTTKGQVARELLLVNWIAFSLVLMSGRGARDFIYFQF